MADGTLVGASYVPADHVAKVTGRAKYAEDFRAEGMLFAKLLLSPMPHARVRNIDASAALAMPGVKAILTASDVPDQNGAEKALTNEPFYAGEPILAVAAVDELTAAEAIEKIQVDLEPLPFVIDPLESLRPGAPNARLDGNVWSAPRPPAPGGGPPAPAARETVKWTQEDFASAGEGQLPMGRALEEWSFGDLDAAFKASALTLDETFVVQSTGHHPMETRSAMAYWQNGKVYLHGSTQSVAFTQGIIAGWLGIPPSDVVLICEYTGGGFGSKGAGAVSMAIPALLSKKANAPVMMRISREEESYIGRARTNMSGRAKVAFSKEGRILGLDLFIVQDSGAYGPMGDFRSGGNAASLIYQPAAMRMRAINVITNTPPRSQQRSPGPMQANGIMEPILTKAAKQLGLDQVALRRLNSPEGKALYGPPLPNGQRRHITSAFVKDALDRGAEAFKWNERKARSGQRRGSKVRGVGVTVGPHGAGSIGWDSIMTIRPDGKLYVQSGVGNLGTHSVMDLARVAADVLAMPWDKVEVVWGNTSKSLPWTCLSVGSQTTHAMTRANHAGAMDAKRKLQQIAAMDLGGSPDDYELGGERVHRRGSPGGGLTYAQAARRAIQLGGAFDGHAVPDDVNPMTKTSAAALAGLGLMGVAKDTYPRDGDTYSFVIGFAEVEVDVETGKVSLVDFLAVGDVGRVINPRSLMAQLNGGSCLGIAHALCQKWVIDPQYGLTLARRFHYNKPLTILDVPANMEAMALDMPDPETPVGARGVGEPPVGAGYGAVMNAIADAVGTDVFRRAPVTADIVLMSLEHGKRMHEPLRAHL
ncbi:MAG TPA: xanthine dehydrogenase family protein molybdopterin-binding subunit [Vicinamibacterales bacterium]|jgi:CO/xanthine dehydrogenase Mo-binding subunit|nr:xanthine dehydrogenase family protein molybdopterin-binding subunit [Vicinamibacterales bacterium]